MGVGLPPFVDGVGTKYPRTGRVNLWSIEEVIFDSLGNPVLP